MQSLSYYLNENRLEALLHSLHYQLIKGNRYRNNNYHGFNCICCSPVTNTLGQHSQHRSTSSTKAMCRVTPPLIHLTVLLNEWAGCFAHLLMMEHTQLYCLLISKPEKQVMPFSCDLSCLLSCMYLPIIRKVWSMPCAVMMKCDRA